MLEKTKELKGLQEQIVEALKEFEIEGVFVRELVLGTSTNNIAEALEENCRIVRNPSTGELERICED